MKRRNIDNAKFRRSLKKSRLTDGFCGGSLMYLKILLVWAFVMMADFLLDFRFEYFWPTWLLLRSVYDSIRYQGAAFSAFFVCITITSDLVCFVFIPVQWLFFLASTYVWVQYVWHTDRGVCLPTVSLWLLYVYVEVSIRLKELKSVPFTLDLCRPFAAHCIGYPVVTLGFGVKSYVSYRLRLRKQREVARGNEFYEQLLHEALPSERRLDVEVHKHEYLPNSEDLISNGAVCGGSNAVAVCHNNNIHNKTTTTSSVYAPLSSPTTSRLTKNYIVGSSSSSIPKNYRKTNVVGGWTNDVNGDLTENGHVSTNIYNDDDDDDIRRYGSSTSYLSTIVGWFNVFAWKTFGINSSMNANCRALEPWTSSGGGQQEYCRDSDEESTGESKDSVDSNNTTNSVVDCRALTTKKNFNSTSNSVKYRGGTKTKKKNFYAASPGFRNVFDGDVSTSTNDSTTQQFVSSNVKDLNSVAQTVEQKEKVQDKDLYLSLESDIEKLKIELRLSRTREQDLRRQFNELTTSDKSAKNELQQCRQQNEQLQTKLQNLVRARQQDKQTIATLEKRVCEEQKVKTQLEQQILTEKKMQKKLEENNKIISSTNPTKLDCTEMCKQRRRETELQLQQVRRDLQQRDEQLTQMENEMMILRQYKDKNQAQSLMSALSALQDKNRHLETSLSAETRIKLDLFSALGDAKRQLEIAQNILAKKDQELNVVRRRFDDFMNGTNPMGAQQMTPTTLSSMDNSKVEALAAALYTAPPYSNAMTGLMFDDAMMPTDYCNMQPSYVPVQNNVGAMMPTTNDSAVRYTPPRSTASH